MLTSVVTVVAGRHEHLARQLAGLRRAGRPRHIVVAMGDPDIAAVCAGAADVLEIDRAAGNRLPLAAARNAGASAAIAAGAELLVFLDADCVPAPDLLSCYATAASAQPDALLSGPVTYLPPPPPGGYRVRELAALTAPHPARPDPAPGKLQPMKYDLFWSLSFAATRATWQRIEGFDPAYTGYGGEDTDFAQRARVAGVPHLMVGGAHAYHQWHPTADPPRQHLPDILRNGRRYRQRWGRWPMTGWLTEFERLGLVVHDAATDDWRPA